MNRVLTERHVARTARGTTAIAASPEVASHAGTAPVTSAGCPSVPSIQKVPWGHADGVEVDLYTLCSPSGMVSKISNFGGVLTELEVPDRNGKLDDVVLGWDSFAQYVKYPSFLGATIGRVGNRISNAHFVLDGKTYMLAANNGPHALHGGIKGWHKRVWQAATKETSREPSLELSLVSKDGDESYPGTVHATTVFTLEKGNTLRIDMTATTDQPTIVNMVNHTYWNLRGGTTGDVKDDLLTLYADRYTPGSPPDGRDLSVAGTPFDFRTPKPIGKDLMSTGNTPPGYDENWIVNGPPNTLRPVARVVDPISGRTMSIESNQPGVQLYTANYMDGSTNGKGRVHAQHSALCLESQRFPNSINVPAWRKDVILRPGQTYRHVMLVTFGTN